MKSTPPIPICLGEGAMLSTELEFFSHETKIRLFLILHEISVTFHENFSKFLIEIPHFLGHLSYYFILNLATFV